MNRHGSAPEPAAGTDDGLSRLIEAEARLAHDLLAAEAEAATLTSTAREAAAAEGSRLQSRIDAEAASLAQRIAGERDAEIARIVAAVEERCGLLQEVSVAAIDRLAADVEARLLSLEEEGLHR